MFIHFGLYSTARVADGRVRYDAATVRSGRYDALMRDFNPRKFDPFEWVDLAQEAGARYLVLTTKHTEGFCLFDSKLTDFKVTRTPFGRDLVGEVVAACHRRKMRVMLYYGLREWHHPHYVERDLPPSGQPFARPDWRRYIEYYHGQVRELCSNYGRIDGIWFDGSFRTEREWQGRKVYRLIKALQPRALVNDRAVHGDYLTPERYMPEDLDDLPFECCQAVMKHDWWYTRSPELFSESYLVQQLAYIACRNGNFLLGIGPAPDGTVPRAQRERMLAVGRWLRSHGEGVYGTRGLGVDSGSEGRREWGGHACTLAHGYCASGDGVRPVGCTSHGSKVYVHLFEWPDTSRVALADVRGSPVKAELMGAGLPLAARRDGDRLVLDDLPASAPDRAVQVVRLTFARPPRFRRRRAPCAPVLDVGREEIVLGPRAATRQGRTVKGYELALQEIPDPTAPPGMRHLVFPWSSTDMALGWRLRARRGGAWRVLLHHYCPDAHAGSLYELRVGRATHAAALPGTGEAPLEHPSDFRRFRASPLGRIRLRKGMNRVVFRPRRLRTRGFFTFFRALVLRREPPRGAKRRLQPRPTPRT
jgi:alpha-L-fucosidase